MQDLTSAVQTAGLEKCGMTDAKTKLKTRGRDVWVGKKRRVFGFRV